MLEPAEVETLLALLMEAASEVASFEVPVAAVLAV